MAKALSPKIPYNLNPNIAVCYAPVFSYAKDAGLPLYFVHYAHEQIFSSHRTSLKDNDWCTMFIFLSGNFSFFMDGHIYTPSFGDVVIIREHENYISLFPEASYVDYYQLCIPSEFFRKAAAADIFVKPFYDRRKADRNLISPDKSSCNIMLEKLRAIEAIVNSKNEHTDILMYTYIIQIMEIVLSAFTAQQPAHQDSKAPSKLNDAILYIHNCFTTLDSVNEVSQACGISDAYLARIFKKHLFCTPNDYITNLRVSYAKYLLLNGYSLTDTCYKSGFNNYTYFISKFKSITGTTPSKFKNS